MNKKVLLGFSSVLAILLSSTMIFADSIDTKVFYRKVVIKERYINGELVFEEKFAINSPDKRDLKKTATFD